MANITNCDGPISSVNTLNWLLTRAHRLTQQLCEHRSESSALLPMDKAATARAFSSLVCLHERHPQQY
eukprot:2171885-Amphidinium_carterae.1